jgi:hypothetical protein
MPVTRTAIEEIASAGARGFYLWFTQAVGRTFNIVKGNSVVTPCGLHSSLRQRGNVAPVVVGGPVKTGPFRFVHQD